MVDALILEKKKKVCKVLYSNSPHFSLDCFRLTAMNVTDFRDNALLKLQVAGPFAGRAMDPTNQEFILIQVEQAEQPGQRRRRTQQVRVFLKTYKYK